MLVSGGAEPSVQAQETWPGASGVPFRSEQPTPAAAWARMRPNVGMRCAVLAALLFAYRGSFAALHALVGNPAFLLGLCICLLAALWLGLRGALVVVFSVALIDRGQALPLPLSAETGAAGPAARSEEHNSELQAHVNIVCRP